MKTGALLIAALLAAGTPGAATDLTPDAMTRATTLNPSEGDVACLTDGRTPDTDPGATAFSWDSVGLLVVEWEAPVSLTSVRMYLGLVNQYAVYTYLGGRFDEHGQREGEAVPTYTRNGIVPFDATGWYEVTMPSDARIDNLGLQVINGAMLYEVQFIGPGGTPVTPTSLGLVKRSFSR
ncbi:MAG: hypothetical protein ABIL09_18955 [Gemmatimonadota bacterium]